MAENATVVREIIAPDGTKYDVRNDGTWVQYTWDGSFVRDSNDWLRSYYGPDATEADGHETASEVIAKLGLFTGK